jgi:mevalonate kinase
MTSDGMRPAASGDSPGPAGQPGPSPSPPPVVVSTPGKLILMGEHAVVYGRPALVAALDLRLRAHFSPPPTAAAAADRAAPADPAHAAHPENPGNPGNTAADIDIDLPGLRHRTTATWDEVLGYAGAARDGWQAYAAHPDVAGFLAMRGDDPAHIVKVALGEVAAALGEHAATAPRLCLRLDSDLPIGSGFGSSAAAAVAIVAGYAAWRGHPIAGLPPAPDAHAPGSTAAPTAPSSAFDAATVERLALEAERRQHGLPSGVDTATSLYGGLLWARRRPEGGLTSERLATSSPLLGRLCVYHTGTPAESTGAVVAAVRAQRDRDPAAHELLCDRMEAATRGFRAQLDLPAEDPAEVVRLMRAHEACLEALGVVPAPVRALVRQVEASGGAAKVSGAGSLAGPGAGSLLVYHPAGPAHIVGEDFLRGFALHSVHLGAAGFRRETP